MKRLKTPATVTQGPECDTTSLLGAPGAQRPEEVLSPQPQERRVDSLTSAK